jgi:hypothetical protein
VPIHAEMEVRPFRSLGKFTGRLEPDLYRLAGFTREMEIWGVVLPRAVVIFPCSEPDPLRRSVAARAGLRAAGEAPLARPGQTRRGTRGEGGSDAASQA